MSSNNTLFLVEPNKESNSSAKEKLAGKRLCSKLIDFLIIFVITIGLKVSFLSFFNDYFFQIASLAPMHIFSNIGEVDFGITATIIACYFTVSYYLLDGKTFGKMFFGLKVESSRGDEEMLSLAECFFRTCGYMICYFLGFVLFFIPFFRKDEMGIPDWFSRTKVVARVKVPLEVSRESNRQLDMFDSFNF